MRLSELLTIPQLKGVSIIAGNLGGNREVESVNMMDAPDIIHFLNPNEFLVTTAYHLKDHPQMLTDLVTTMSEQGCAGLGIKTKRFLNEVPEEVIQLANQLSFPIIELPLELSLGQVVNHTLQAILDKRAAELTLALQTHKQFTHIIMQGKGLKSLLHDLAQMIQHPVQLIDQHFKPIYQTKANPDFPLLIDELTFSAVRASPISLSVIDSRQTYTLFPVHISEKKTGFLIIIGEIRRSDRLTSLTIEQATNVISFSLMKENALRQQERSVRNDFFQHFLAGTFATQEEIIGRASEFSLQQNQRYICAAGKIDGDDFNPSYALRHAKTDDIYDFLESEVAAITPKIHFFTKGESCILLLEVPEDIFNHTAATEDMLRHLQCRVYRYFGNTISFGVSNLCHHFLHVTNAYKEATDALSQGQLSKEMQYIQTYRTKDIMELLRLVPHDDLKNYYTFALKGFTGERNEEESSLLETLSVYLETHCQISETAKRLYVHRNTVVYRIEKCEEILGKSLKDSETTLQIRLALRIRRLLENGA